MERYFMNMQYASFLGKYGSSRTPRTTTKKNFISLRELYKSYPESNEDRLALKTGWWHHTSNGEKDGNYYYILGILNGTYLP
jgi:hypothetical protein